MFSLLSEELGKDLWRLEEVGAALCHMDVFLKSLRWYKVENVSPASHYTLQKKS